MRRHPLTCLSLFFALFAASSLVLWAQGTAKSVNAEQQAAVQQRIEAYLRYLFAWGPETQVRVGSLLESAVPNLYSVLVQAGQGERQFQDVFLVTPDGRYLFQGDLLDTTTDPYAEVRARIVTAGHPSKGPVNAPVTLVEYGDFQCPTCAALHPVLKKLLAERGDVRLVFKDLPLTDKHDWAMAAAIAGQCAYQQSNDAFWQLHDYFFENQKQLTARNLQSRLDAFVWRGGFDPADFRACRQEERTRARVEQSLREARQLQAPGTPTIFVNGRLYAPEQPQEFLLRLIAYEAQIRQQGTAPR